MTTRDFFGLAGLGALLAAAVALDTWTLMCLAIAGVCFTIARNSARRLADERRLTPFRRDLGARTAGVVRPDQGRRLTDDECALLDPYGDLA